MKYVIEKRIGGQFYVLSVYNPWADPTEFRWSRTERPVPCSTVGIALAVLLDLNDPEATCRQATSDELLGAD